MNVYIQHERTSKKVLCDLEKLNCMNKIYFHYIIVPCAAIHFDWVSAIKKKIA
jgi:hypothetical protein